MAARPRRGRRNRSAYATYDRPGARALYGAGRLATEPAVDSGGLLLYFIMLHFISLAPHCASSHSAPHGTVWCMQAAARDAARAPGWEAAA